MIKIQIEGKEINFSDVITDELVSKIRKMVLRNEFKRRQAAPTIKIHDKSFGYGRRIPLAHKYTII